MSKTMKKLISMLLSLAMVLSSIGMVAFADETTQATVTAEATEAPVAEATEDAAEATAEPTAEPTEAPTPEPTATPEPTLAPYEGDVYYERALSLCSTLGIIQGYDDGSVKPESTVTRAEMAAIILRMLNTTATNAYADSFNDVTTAHWAADTIQTAANLGIISGMGDGSFLPDGNVMYEQVAKMLVCALGFETDAKLDGGYPDGYLKVVKNLEINEHAEGAKGVVAERGTVIKLVYNALLTKMNEISGTDSNGNILYDATRTLAKVKFGIIDAEGILTATAKTSIDPSIDELLDNQIVIDGEILETELTGLEEYIGSKIVYFYLDKKGEEPVVIAVSGASTRSETIEINTLDIKKIEGFESGNGVIYMEKGAGTDKKFTGNTIVYNGEAITLSDYNIAVNADETSTKKEYRFYKRDEMGNVVGSSPMTFNEFLLPAVGTIKLTDADGDGKYDVMFVDAYETFVVTSVTSKLLNGMMNNASKSFNINTEDNEDLKITVTRAGTEAKPRNLKKNDVVSVKRNFDETVVDFVATGESIIGSAESKTVSDGTMKAVIGGTEYEVDANAVADLKTGVSSTFYLDMFGRIGYIESSSSGKLSGSEMYGWIVSAYLSADQTDYVLRIFNQEGKAVDYTLAGTVDYWAGNARTATTVNTKAQMSQLITDVMDSSKLTWAIDTTSDGTENKYPLRLCKFKANSKNQILQLYMAVDSSVVTDENALGVYTENLRNTGATGSMISGKIVEDGIVGFKVPNVEADMVKPGEYESFEVKASTYVSREGTARDFIIGEFTDNRYANIVVEFKDSSTATASADNYGTVDDNPCILVDSVISAIDENDEAIYIIKGWRGGSEVRYSTTVSTTLQKMATSDLFKADKNKYATSDLWDAKSGEPLTDYLRPGDVIGIAGGTDAASILIKMVDVRELTKLAAGNSASQFTGYDAASETRDGIGVGAVADMEIVDSDTYLSVGGHSWILGNSVSVDVVEISTDAKGNIINVKVTEDTIEPTELAEFDATTIEGDYMFFRNYKNNAQREAVVYRYNY